MWVHSKWYVCNKEVDCLIFSDSLFINLTKEWREFLFKDWSLFGCTLFAFFGFECFLLVLNEDEEFAISWEFVCHLDLKFEDVVEYGGDIPQLFRFAASDIRFKFKYKGGSLNVGFLFINKDHTTCDRGTYSGGESNFVIVGHIRVDLETLISFKLEIGVTLILHHITDGFLSGIFELNTLNYFFA